MSSLRLLTISDWQHHMRNKLQLIGYSTGKGGLFGLALGVAMAITLSIFSLLTMWLLSGHQYSGSTLESVLYLAIGAPIIILSLSGLLTGLLVGWCARGYRAACIIGTIITGIFVILWAYLGIIIGLMGGTYGFYIIPASLVSIVGGGWVGQKVHQNLIAQQGTYLSLDSSVPIADFFRGTIIFALILPIIYLAIHVSINQHLSSKGIITETHMMYWSNQPYRRCSPYVELEFESAPGYIISFCSSELLSMLENSQDEIIEVAFEREFVSSAWEYKLKQIGPSTEIPELSLIGSLHCRGFSSEDSVSNSGRPCGSGEFPLRQTYRFEKD